MSKIDCFAADTNGKSKIMSVLKSVILSILITFVAMMLLAVFVTYGPVPESAAGQCVIAAVIVSVFTASLYVSKNLRSKGWLVGIVTAALYLVIMLLIGILAFDGVSFGGETLKMLVILMIAGTAGGISGVNVKRKRKR